MNSIENLKNLKNLKKLLMIFGIMLLVLWLLGAAASYAGVGFIHLLLAVAIIVILFQAFTRRRLARGN